MMLFNAVANAILAVLFLFWLIPNLCEYHPVARSEALSLSAVALRHARWAVQDHRSLSSIEADGTPLLTSSRRGQTLSSLPLINPHLTRDTLQDAHSPLRQAPMFEG
jgi:hypothetical protein